MAECLGVADAILLDIKIDASGVQAGAE